MHAQIKYLESVCSGRECEGLQERDFALEFFRRSTGGGGAVALRVLYGLVPYVRCLRSTRRREREPKSQHAGERD